MMLTLLRRFAPDLIVGALIVGALFLAYRFGTANAAARYELQLSNLQKDSANMVDAINENYRKQEQAKEQQMAAIEAQHQEQIQDEKHKADAAIAAVRAGTVRVRDQLTCPNTTSAMPGPAASTGSGDAAAQRGLSAEDAELLLREAGRADEVVLQLQACQAVLAADRGVK